MLAKEAGGRSAKERAAQGAAVFPSAAASHGDGAERVERLSPRRRAHAATPASLAIAERSRRVSNWMGRRNGKKIGSPSGRRKDCASPGWRGLGASPGPGAAARRADGSRRLGRVAEVCRPEVVREIEN